jgi:hypothetical protein
MERMGRATKKVTLRGKQRGNVGSERVSKSVATLSDSHRKLLMIYDYLIASPYISKF